MCLTSDQTLQKEPLTFGSWRQEDCEIRACQGDTAKVCLKHNKVDVYVTPALQMCGPGSQLVQMGSVGVVAGA